jgi:hypothetical protein
MVGQNVGRGQMRILRQRGLVAVAAIAVMSIATSASADRIENKVAVFSALDKVTATIKKLEIELNETIEYGALKVTPRACYSRPATEQPKTTTFVEVDEVQLDGTEKRIFAGWMFAESPGLNAVEHPVFDVWLTECQKPTNVVVQRAPTPQGPDGAPGGALTEPTDEFGDSQRRRVRR